MIDAKDKKILSELIINSKISTTQIAKKAGVSREVAIYRIKKLETSKIIRKYFTLINYEALGFKRHVVFMQLKGVSLEKEQEILEYLKNHDYITYLSPIIGKWNFVFDLIIENEVKLKETIKEINKELGLYIGSFILLSGNIEGKFYPTKLVGINKEIQFKLSDKYSLDDVDKIILRLLSTNARIEYSSLSQKLDMPATTISYRIKNLEKAGIIQGYTTSIDYQKLGWEFYNLQLKSKNYDKKKFLEFIKTHKKIIFYYEYLGHENWDIDLGIIAKNSDDLRKVILEIKQYFGEEISMENMYLVAGLVKDNILPEGVLK